MSKPDIVPKQTASGIALDPTTLERVIPESRRPDGTVRKQLKVRPGFTPQEDVSRFRGSRQQQHDKNQLPKGHILGWIAPSSSEKKKKTGSSGVVGVTEGEVAGGEKSVSASAAKRAKKKAKKQAEKEEAIRKAWDDDSDEDKDKDKVGKTKADDGEKNQSATTKDAVPPEETKDVASEERKESSKDGDALAEELEKKLDVH